MREEDPMHRLIVRELYLTPVIAILAFMLGGGIQRVGHELDEAKEKRVTLLLQEDFRGLRMTYQAVRAETEKAQVRLEGLRRIGLESSRVVRPMEGGFFGNYLGQVDRLEECVSKLKAQLVELDTRMRKIEAETGVKK